MSELELLELLGPPDYGISDHRGAAFIYICGNRVNDVDIGPDGLVKTIGSRPLDDAHLSDLPRWRRYYDVSDLPPGSSYLGIEVAVDAEHARSPGGVRVVGIVPDSPASKSILKAGDVIVALDGKPVGAINGAAFQQMTAAIPAGTVVTARFTRLDQSGTSSSQDVKLTAETLRTTPKSE